MKNNFHTGTLDIKNRGFFIAYDVEIVVRHIKPESQLSFSYLFLYGLA